MFNFFDWLWHFFRRMRRFPSIPMGRWMRRWEGDRLWPDIRRRLRLYQRRRLRHPIWMAFDGRYGMVA